MECRPALNYRKRFTDRRGAVLLLAVYFASLALLIFGGISLQRTVVETRASQVSRDKQQSFYLAEGALDFAVKQLETSDLPDDCYTPDDSDVCTKISGLPSGTSFTLTTTNARIVDQDTQEITRQIAATGTASGASAMVTATVAAQGPIKGGWGKGSLFVLGMDMGGTGLLLGNLRSARGTAAAIKLWDNVHHEGGLQIGKSEATDLTTNPSDLNHYTGAWKTPMGSVWNDKPGVYLQQFGSHPAPETTSDQPAIIPMSPLPTVDPPYAAAQCAGNITTAASQQLTIRDGNLNPPDLSGSPNDDLIVLCLQYVQNAAAGAKVIFESPATVYLTGRDGNGYALSSNNVGASDIYAVSPGYSVPEHATLMPSGLKIIVTKAADGVGGKVSLYSKRFAGSIYAPESGVYFTMASGGEYRLENIVGREAAINTWSQSLAIDNPPANPQQAATTVTIQSWSSD